MKINLYIIVLAALNTARLMVKCIEIDQKSIRIAQEVMEIEDQITEFLVNSNY